MRDGRMHGFQLWANLPASLKMTQPRYQDIAGATFPRSPTTTGREVRVVCGNFWGRNGPGRGRGRRSALPRRLRAARQAESASPSKSPRHAFAYVFAGSGHVPRRLGAARRPDGAVGEPVPILEVAPREPGQPLARALRSRRRGRRPGRRRGVRFLLVSGKPLEEPVAWYGPDRHEHAARTSAGVQRTARRHVHQAF